MLLEICRCSPRQRFHPLDAKALHLAEKQKRNKSPKQVTWSHLPASCHCSPLWHCCNAYEMCISMAQAADSGQALLWTALGVSWQHLRSLSLYLGRWQLSGFSALRWQNHTGKTPTDKMWFRHRLRDPNMGSSCTSFPLCAAVHTSWILSDTKLFKSNSDSGTCVPNFRPFRIAGD